MAEQKIGLHPDVDTVHKRSPQQGEIYEIKVLGHLDQEWSEWLGSLAITHDNEGNTLLSGMIPDQAALHGVLVKIRDLGLTIFSLQRLENYKGNQTESRIPFKSS